MDAWDEDTVDVGVDELAVAAPSAPRACLTVIAGTAVGYTFHIPEGGAAVIGRAPVAEIRIVDESISRRHARLHHEGPDLILEDLASRNGTYVNGRRLAGAAVLDDGDKIQIGHATVLRFAYHDELDDAFHASLVSSALRDPLTKVFNKRYLLQRLDGELKFARRHGAAVSLLMLDVDHFKAINDERGHLAGDAVLVRLAGVLQRAVRNEDVVARFGGEEFSIILRATGIDHAAALGERLRKLVELTAVVHHGREVRATVSVGIAAFPSPDVESPEQLLEAADRALYRAKHAGRNRVSR